jgi:signal transduction histidine kinase
MANAGIADLTAVHSCGHAPEGEQEALNRTTTLLTGFLLAFSLLLVSWWTWFQVNEAEKLELAGAFLERQDIPAAAEALGGNPEESLQQLGASRRRMFLSEGIVFAVIVAAAGTLLLVNLRRHRRLLTEHDNFLAGATHELKTPLATIQLLLESLRDDRLPEVKRKRYLQSGLVEAARLESGLANVLTAAGLRSSAPRRRHPEPAELAVDVQLAVDKLRARADAAQVTLDATDLRSAPTVRDAEAMALVLHNIIENAIKYTPEGGRIGVRTWQSDAYAMLEVTDSGEGMDQETLARAFDPFWRGSTNGSGGAGLGLHLVRELVSADQGDVTASSNGRGKGTRIEVRMPLAGGSS